MNASTTRKLRVIDPMDVEPMKNPSQPRHVSGKARHRRVVSKIEDPDVQIDIGFNMFDAGPGASEPYAYYSDEMCYLPTEGLEVISNGQSVMVKRGHAMWRPAGASSEGTCHHADNISICAFGPARMDPWSHRIPPEDIGNWPAGEAPKVMFRDVDSLDSEPLKGGDEGVTVKYIYSAARDGARKIEMSALRFPAGTSAVLDAPVRDEIYYVDIGEINFISGGETFTAAKGQFVYRARGVPIERAVAGIDATLIRWQGPAQ